MTADIPYGRAAHTAYANARQLAVLWEDIEPEEQAAWCQAAGAVLHIASAVLVAQASGAELPVTMGPRP